MSELNEIKRIVNESRVHGVYNWNLETIASLITTIESQKEKIIDLESQKALLDEVLPHLEVSGNIILKQQKEISSLKAITELAVKGLKEIACLNVDSAYSAGTIARNTFSEIEVLQNAHIQPKSPS